GVRLDRLVAIDDGNTRYAESACETGAHVHGLFVEVARDVAKTNQECAVRLDVRETLTRRKARPEESVGGERRLVGLEFDVVRVRLDGRTEHARIHFLFRRELVVGDRIQSRERLRPVIETSCLGRRVDGRETSAFAAPEFTLPPVPFLRVEDLEARV